MRPRQVAQDALAQRRPRRLQQRAAGRGRRRARRTGGSRSARWRPGACAATGAWPRRSRARRCRTARCPTPAARRRRRPAADRGAGSRPARARSGRRARTPAAARATGGRCRAAMKTGQASTTSRASSRTRPALARRRSVSTAAPSPAGSTLVTSWPSRMPVGHRLGQPLRQPAVALRPRQHHVAVLGIGIAPRVVVNAGPRRGPRQVGAEVVAAGVLHPPAQPRRGEAARSQELGHRYGVELRGTRRGRRPPAAWRTPRRPAAIAPAAIALHLARERPRAARGPRRWRRARGTRPPASGRG